MLEMVLSIDVIVGSKNPKIQKDKIENRIKRSRIIFVLSSKKCSMELFTSVSSNS